MYSPNGLIIINYYFIINHLINTIVIIINIITNVSDCTITHNYLLKWISYAYLHMLVSTFLPAHSFLNGYDNQHSKTHPHDYKNQTFLFYLFKI